MGEVQVYSTKITIKSSVDLGDLYRYLYDKLLKDGWEGKYGGGRFEYYYYHKAVGKLWFIDINWQARQNFWKEEPKIDWIMDLNLKTVAYDAEKKFGDISISIKSAVDVEEFQEPSINTISEKILSNYFGLKPRLLKKLKDKIRKGKTQIAMRDLFIYSEEFKRDIINYLKGYYK